MVVLMMIGPTSVSAASTDFHLEIVSSSCIGGYLTSSIKAVAGGDTGATELDVLVSGQHLKNGHWIADRGSVGFGSKFFKADGSRHHLTADRSFMVDPGRTERVIYSFGAQHRDTTLWDATIASVSCSG